MRRYVSVSSRPAFHMVKDERGLRVTDTGAIH